MATIAEVKAQLVLDTQKWKQSVERSKKDAEDLGSVIRKQKAVLTEFGAASAATFAVLAAAIYKATQQFAQFDQELANLRSVSNLTAEQLRQVKDAAMEIGPQFGRSAASATQALTEFSKAGYDVSRLANGELAQAMALIISGEMEVGEAAVYAANSLNIYKNENLSLKQIADTAVAAANASSTSVKEMADANRQLGAVAAMVGHTFEEVNLQFALNAQAGLRGSDGATSMKTALLQLANPTEEAKRVMADLGLEFYKTDGRMKSFMEIGEMLRQKLGHLNDQSKQMVLSVIGGSDSIRFFSALMQQTTADYEKMRQAMSQGSAEETAKTKLDSLNGSIQKLSAEAGVAASKFSESFSPAARSAVDTITRLIQSYNQLSPETRSAITTTTLVGTAMTGTAATLGLATLAVGRLTTAVGGLNGVLTILQRHPIIFALTALVGVATFVATTYQRNAEAARQFAAAQDNLNRAIYEARTANGESIKSYQDMARQIEEVGKRYEELIAKQEGAGVTPGKFSLAALFNDNAKAAQQYGRELEEVKKKMAELGVTTANYKTKAEELKQSIYSNAKAVLEKNKAEIDHAVQLQDSINKIQQAQQAYQSLANQESLSAEQKQRLAETVKTLTDLIPGLNTQEMENGKIIVTNTSLIGDKIRALMQEKSQAQDTANSELAAAKAEAEARIASYTAQIKAIQALAAARNALVSQGVDAELPDNHYRREQQQIESLNDGVSVAKANIAEIDAALRKIQSGTGYTGPTSLSGGGGLSYTIPDAPKKGTGEKSAEEVAREADQAMQERFQRELAAEKQRYDTGIINEEQYVEALKRIRSDYNDWLQQHDSERYNLENEAARMSFQYSANWIANERRLMEDAGRSEIEILQMELAAWERVSARKTYLIEDQRQAQENLRRVQQALVSEMEANLRRARELEAQESIADAEKRYKAQEDAIQRKIDKLNREAEAQNRLLEYERERQKLADLQAQRNAIAADQRFELIERDANGELVRRLVADLPRLTELDRQIGEQRQRIADMQREDETRKRREALETELRDTREANQKKLAALKAYWDEMTTQERITQDIRNAIVKDGMEATLKNVETYLDAMVAKYKAAQAQMKLSLPSGSFGGGSGGGSSYSAIREQMARNSAEWHTATEERKRQLEEENQRLGRSIGGKYDPSTGRWTFHTGVDRVPGSTGADVPSLLQAGERVLSVQQNNTFEKFMLSLMAGRIPMFTPSFAGAGAGSGGGIVVERMEVNVQTDNGEKVLREIERAVWSMRTK